MSSRPGPALVAAVSALALAAACSRATSPARLGHEAYVWQRLWSDELAMAVRTAPPEIGVLHVLARELEGAPRGATDVHVDLPALASSGRDVVAVMRIAGTAPLDASTVDEMAALAADWRRQGVRVRGLEIDHDCASARLPAYLDWLVRARAGLPGLSLTITALPTWLASPQLPRLAAAVDEVVLQVHTIAAPVLFDAASARHHLEAWSRTAARPFRVALPTYRARLKDGRWLGAAPTELSRFVAELRERPIRGLRGVVWFRLGHEGDANAWGARTLTAVVRGDALAAQVVPHLVAGPAGAFDVVLENAGSVDAWAPTRVAFSGELDVLDGVQGFTAQGRTLASATPLRLPAGAKLAIGFVRGEAVHVDVP